MSFPVSGGKMEGSSPSQFPSSPSFQTVTAGVVRSSGVASAVAILINGDPQGQTGPLLLAGTLPGTGVPTTGTWPAPELAALIAASPLLADIPTAYIDQAGAWQLNTSPGTPGFWNGAAPTPVPVVSGVSADTVTSTSAVLHGLVNPEGLPTNYYFQYGTDTNYGTLVPLLPGGFVGSDTNNDPVSATVTGLTPGQTYHFALVASSAAGPAPIVDFTFQALPTPVAVPTLTAVSSSLVTQTTAQMSGSVAANGAPTNFYFEYGTTTAYGTQVPGGVGTPVGSSFTTVGVVAGISGLTPGQTYHFRSQASNSAGSATPSADQTFTAKSATAPTAVTQAATSPTINGATLNGSCNPEGNATTFHFEVGTVTGVYSLGHFPGTDAAVASDSSPHSVSQVVTSLAPGIQYFYRLVTHSTAGGTTFGSELSFTTSVVTGNLAAWTAGIAGGGTLAPGNSSSGYSLLEGSIPSLTIINAPAVLPGPKALQFVCSDAEMTAAPVSGRTRDVNEPAVSATGPQHQFVSGSEGFASWDFVLPASFPTMLSTSWLLLGEFHGPFDVGGTDVWEAGAQFASPATALRCALVNGQEVISLWRAYPDYKMLCSWPLVRGVRNQVIVHMIFSPDPAVGLREAWMNGVQATFFNGSKTLMDTTLFQDSSGNTQRLTFFQMVYMLKGTYGKTTPVTVVFGDSKVGPTFASVQ